MDAPDFTLTRVCKTCLLEKTPTSFPLKNYQGKRYYARECKPCANERASVARHARLGKTPGTVRRQELRDLKRRGLRSCRTCGVTKTLSEFRQKSLSIDGEARYVTTCKACEKDRNRASYYKYRDARLEASRKRQARNSEALKAKKAEYVRRNRSRITSRQGAWAKKKRSEDPMFAMKWRIRSAFSLAFLKSGFPKNSKTQDILGCDWETLKAHLESKFLPGMTWGNRGKYGWHIDHIVPLATARTEEDMIRLNHYSNLQPLWAEDNLRKGAKYDGS